MFAKTLAGPLSRMGLHYGWVVVAVTQLGAAFGAGLSKSMLASYVPAFVTAGAMCLVASAIVLLIGAKKPAPPVA